ncbi:DUF6479 family protein [Streptomyces sp. Rer75]|uniref:DUF6479 family protein n=1 Tax=Streptomyces sp. Rer75 TaxID=2750011 RepID=UPI0015D03A44|nr:DUF6479 family protein [Streptomyces sp. Rer75]QLH22278.1 hypothetical protein HYQ63_18040 [Streptomyces sp. Rer75]
MDTYAMDFAVPHDLVVGTAPLVVGIVVVVILIVAIWWGIRLRAREPVPSQEPKPRSGAWQQVNESEREARQAGHGPGHQDDQDRVGYQTQNREPEELSPDGVRRRPHQLGGSGTRASGSGGNEGRKTWSEGSSGSFGGG